MCPFTQEECTEKCALYIKKYKADFNPPCSFVILALGSKLIEAKRILESIPDQRHLNIRKK